MDTLASVLTTWMFPALMVAAACTDLMWRKIPNAIPAALLAGFGLLAVSGQMDWTTVGLAFAIGFAAFVVGFALFALNQMGGGDVKLIATSLPWFGAGMLSAEYVMLFSVYGALLTVVFILRKLSIVQLLLVSNRLSAPLAGYATTAREIPYGLPIAIAALQLNGAMAALHVAG